MIEQRKRAVGEPGAHAVKTKCTKKRLKNESPLPESRSHTATGPERSADLDPLHRRRSAGASLRQVGSQLRPHGRKALLEARLDGRLWRGINVAPNLQPPLHLLGESHGEHPPVE